MRNFELRSKYPCLIKWSKGEDFLDEGLALVFNQPEKLYVYPATGNKGDIPFVLDMNSNNIPAKIFSLDDKDIYLLDRNMSDALIVKEQLTVKGQKLKYFIGSQTLKIESNKIIKTFSIIKPKSYEIISYNNFAILKIKGNNSDQTIIFNIDNNESQIIEGNKIEITDNELVVEKYGREEKYILTNGKITKIKSLELLTRNPKIIPLSFLQKIKNKEYKEACLLVSDSLSPSEEKISSYFGEIKDFLTLNENEFLVIKKTGHYVLKLDLNDNKISNIEILD